MFLRQVSRFFSLGVVEESSFSLEQLLYGLQETASKACCDEHQKTKRYRVRFAVAITLLPSILFAVND